MDLISAVRRFFRLLVLSLAGLTATAIGIVGIFIWSSAYGPAAVTVMVTGEPSLSGADVYHNGTLIGKVHAPRGGPFAEATRLLEGLFAGAMDGPGDSYFPIYLTEDGIHRIEIRHAGSAPIITELYIPDEMLSSSSKKAIFIEAGEHENEDSDKIEIQEQDNIEYLKNIDILEMHISAGHMLTQQKYCYYEDDGQVLDFVSKRLSAAKVTAPPRGAMPIARFLIYLQARAGGSRVYTGTIFAESVGDVFVSRDMFEPTYSGVRRTVNFEIRIPNFALWITKACPELQRLGQQL